MIDLCKIQEQSPAKAIGVPPWESARDHLVVGDAISADEVFSVFCEDDEPQGSVAVLHRAWFDDSKDGMAERYVIAAGLIGNLQAWRDFEVRWKAELRRVPAIEHFHTKEWRSLTGEFFQFCDAEKWPKPTGRQAANEKRESLKRIIESSSLIGLSVGVLIPDFNRMRNCDSRAADFFRPDPYEGALQSFIYEAALAVKRVGRHDCIAYVSDDSNKAAIYSAVYSDFKAKNPNIGKRMRGLSHLDDKKWPGLQAADMVANVSNQLYKTFWDKPEDERKLMSLPELESKFYKVAHWDLRYMCHILKDCTGVDLFENLGIDRKKHKSDEQVEQERKERLAAQHGKSAGV